MARERIEAEQDKNSSDLPAGLADIERKTKAAFDNKFAAVAD